MNRITMSKDGTPRFTLKIEVRISAYDMAIHLMNHFQYQKGMDSSCQSDETIADRNQRLENNLKELMSRYSSKELLAIVSESIKNYGMENPHYSVSDSGHSATVDFLCGYLIRKYPRFQAIRGA